MRAGSLEGRAAASGARHRAWGAADLVPSCWGALVTSLSCSVPPPAQGESVPAPRHVGAFPTTSPLAAFLPLVARRPCWAGWQLLPQALRLLLQGVNLPEGPRWLSRQRTGRSYTFCLFFQYYEELYADDPTKYQSYRISLYKRVIVCTLRSLRRLCCFWSTN